MRTFAAILIISISGCASADPPDARVMEEEAVSRQTSGNVQSGYPLSHTKDASNLPSKIALATDDEPGQGMIISGTVYEADGVTPAKDAIVYLYQTDARGVYSEEEGNHACPKLRGYLKTDADGRYEVNSIKPGLYPHIPTAAAHIHVHVQPQGQPEYRPPDFRFEGDPRLTEWHLSRVANEPEGFGLIKLIPDEKGILRGVRNIRPVAPATQNAPPAIEPAANPKLESELRDLIANHLDRVMHGGGTRIFAQPNLRTNDTGLPHGDFWVMHPLAQKTIELTDVKMHDYGQTAILNYRLIERTELKGQKFTKSSRKTAVFMHRDDKWQIVAYQSSPIAFERVEAKVDPKILDAYVGEYLNPLWGRYDVTREGNTLVFTSANDYRYVYLTESETEFFIKDAESRDWMLQTVSFVRDGNGNVTHCIVRENDGQNIVVRKTR